MATAAQINKFILQIAPCAQKAYKIVGKVMPSVCIGMACVESGYGTAGSCKHHSYLGHKVGSGKTATKYWKGKFFTSKTKEEYTVGTHTVITSAFRAYDSMEQCVFNFYELLNTSLYHRVTNCDYKTQMKQIKQCGYMTSSTEVNSVISIIEKYDLTRFDYDVVSNKTDTNIDKNIVIPPITITKGNRAQFDLLVTYIKCAINIEYGYNLHIDTTLSDELFEKLENVILKKGDNHKNTVYVLQLLLKWWGYSLTADGKFGSNTERIVKLFQAHTGQSQTGTTIGQFWCKIWGK